MAKMHLSMNLEGCLRNFKGRKIKIFSDENGRELTDKQAREYIAECIAKGWRVIPMSENCRTFDYQEGCQCHKKQQQQSKTGCILCDHGDSSACFDNHD